MIRLLHISDLHFGERMTFDQSLVQDSLLTFVADNEVEFNGLLITGDIAYSGRHSEYVLAEVFLGKLIDRLALEKGAVTICPGNHDVDRLKVKNLSRTLDSTEDADSYFSSPEDCIHIANGQSAFVEFYERILGRKFSKQDAINGPQFIKSKTLTLEVWELNTAAFCRDEMDHGNLWVGRASFARISDAPPGDSVRVLIGHHPIEWLTSEEESRIRAIVSHKFSAYIRGHLHDGGYAATNSGQSDLIQISAGALYQGATLPIEANIIEITNKNIRICPIRYVDNPIPAWVPDNGKLGASAMTEISFPLSVVRDEEDSIEHVPTQTTLKFSHPQLFTNNFDDPIFVEPRICNVPAGSVTPENTDVTEHTIDEILSKYDYVQIEVDTEHGATILANYLSHKLQNEFQTKSEVFSASKIPNYSAKLEKFYHDEVDSKVKAIILDDFTHRSHQKMIEAVVNSKRFSKIITIITSPQINSMREIEGKNKLFESPVFYVWPLDRLRLRALATQVFSPLNEEDVDFAVNKTYNDLISLAIPINPTNAIMYLHILRNEVDFVPLDRISIISRYLTESLTRSSDQMSGEFGVRDRLSLLSSFIFDRFMLGQTSFSLRNWSDFCSSYQTKTFSDFDIVGVIGQLVRSRVILDYNGKYFVRYAFVYDFLVGMHAASSPAKLDAFLSGGHHRKLPRVVEVMASIALDPLPLLQTLKLDLDRHLEDFQKKYVQESFDPVSLIEWGAGNGDQENDFWSDVKDQIEEGPSTPIAIDRVKESVLAESRSADQEVLIQDFSALEVDLFRSAYALSAALRVAVQLDGHLKMDAFRSILRSYLIILQVGTYFSKTMALSRVFRWGALLVINKSFDESKTPDDFDEIVPWVITSLDLSVAEKICEQIGTRRLGAAFKAILRTMTDASEFEMYILFALILRTKPRDWDLDLELIISNIDYRKWRQMHFLDLLMYDFKNEPNTIESKAKIKTLVALVRAKRSSHKKMPGMKSIKWMRDLLQKNGMFDN